MNIQELSNQLNEIGISSKEYYLHGLFGSTDDNDKLALLRIGGIFEVYFKEKGIKRIIGKFETENEACNYFLQKMKDKIQY